MSLQGSVLAVLLACSAAHAAVPLNWRWSNPTPHGANIYDMAYSQGGLLAQVGEAGQLFTSVDLVQFRPRPTGVTNSLRGVTWFGSRLVISAAAGKILWSDDLNQFNVVDLGTADWLESAASSANRVVVVGDNGKIFRSNNAEAWTPVAPQAQWLRSVAFGGAGNGRFVAVGENGFITVSLDGITWGAAASPTTADLNRVAWINDRFWIAGNGGVVMTNTTRNTWDIVPVGSAKDLFGIAGNATEVSLVGRDEIRSSLAPFTTWTVQTAATSPAPPPWTYYSGLWLGDQFVASGKSGIFVGGYPTNGAPASTWSAYYDPPRNWIWGMVRVPDLFVACGEVGGVFTSTDGYRFDQEFVPDTARNELLMGIGGDGDMLVTVGTAGTILYSPNDYQDVITEGPNGEPITTRVSLLGIVWNEVTPRPTTANLSGVGKFGTAFYAVGASGTILGSVDGRSWSPRGSGVTATLSSVASSNTRVVAVGDAGALTTSDNGLLWAPRNSGTDNWLTQVRFLNNQFVAVGENGWIVTSPDGLAWTRRTAPTTAWLNDVTFANGNYWIAGSQGTALRSADAIGWEQIRVPTSKSLYAVASSERRVLFAGVEGAILRARTAFINEPVDFVTYGRDGSGSIFVFNGIVDQQFHLEWRDSWGPWQRGDLLEIFDNSGLFFHYETEPPIPMRVYRTILAE